MINFSHAMTPMNETRKFYTHNNNNKFVDYGDDLFYARNFKLNSCGPVKFRVAPTLMMSFNGAPWRCIISNKATVIAHCNGCTYTEPF